MHLAELFDLNQFTYRAIFEGLEYPWDALKILHRWLLENIQPSIPKNLPEGVHLYGKEIYISPDCLLAPPLTIKAPVLIGAKVELRPGAYLRGDVLVGEGTIIGHDTEVKNSILMNYVEVPHFNYIGDSVLGNHSHTGAGVILSNYKISREKSVKIKLGDEEIITGLEKLGAILGDSAQIGCNSVTNPGTIVGRNTIIYPLSIISGYIPPDTIVKNKPTYEQTPLIRER
jgi:NDP-sugar pyrophosphorylase family protein